MLEANVIYFIIFFENNQNFITCLEKEFFVLKKYHAGVKTRFLIVAIFDPEND